MKRVVFDRFGPPAEVLHLQDDVPAPQPKRGEVLVRMLASPINPSDLMYVAGKYGLKPSLPATPGFEGVGVVEATGGGLLGWFRKGKRVAVVCHPLVQLQYRNAGVAKDIAKQVSKKLKEHDSTIQLVSRKDIDDWADKNDNTDYVAIGKGVKADMVVGIDLESFSDLEGATLYRGQAICKIAVYDVKVGHDPVWERPMPKLLYPPNSAQPANDCPAKDCYVTVTI